ncbi:MAG TPA: GDSL-type esterase/lipase family protein [Solirubrobacterales bacterium]|jgi:lysophospholipase L1-like esterase|nr:GDSL-type esterase/lipase family protein [Solirubrobacterales bacterium]
MLERYLMFFGDSHTAGSGDPAALGWVGRAAAAALEAGIPLTAYNLGVGGETSVEVAARWRAEALPRLPAEGDPRAVFAFGVNDLTLRNGAPRCSHEESLGALERVLDGADALGMRNCVVGPAAIDDEAENERIAELSRAFQEICARREAPFVPLVEDLRSSEPWRRELAAGDGAHPDARGYEEMARLVLAAGWIDWLRS